jgi:monofunctional biosynthetic peptidoglycan transglycosylase
MVPNPRYYDSHRNAKGLMRKSAIILARMPAAEVP